MIRWVVTSEHLQEGRKCWMAVTLDYAFHLLFQNLHEYRKGECELFDRPDLPVELKLASVN